MLICIFAMLHRMINARMDLSALLKFEFGISE